MSPSIYGSTKLILSTKNTDLRMFNKPEIRKVKRVLFGPPDQKATQKFLDEELRKLIDNKSEKWNFNFKTERTLSSTGLFEWKSSSPTKNLLSPVKRKFDTDLILNDLTAQYYDISDADVVRSSSSSSSSSRSSVNIKSSSSEQISRIQQSRITDFMKTTKRPSSSSSSSSSSLHDISKKSEWNSEIPMKIPRLDISSS